MDRTKFDAIIGIDKFFEIYPDVEWSHFCKVMDYKWYRKFDNLEQIHKAYLELVMADFDKKNVVKFKFNDVEFMTNESMRPYMAGFEIINMSTDKKSTAYEVADLEEGVTYLRCSEFLIEVYP